MSITWNTGLAAERARHNLKLKKKNKKRNKLQAPSSKLPGGWALESTSKKDLDSQKIPDIK